VNPRILVVGAAGFLGRAVARHFALQGDWVYGVDLAPRKNAPIQELKAYQSLRLPDRRFSALVKEWQPDACVHCGGLASVPYSQANPQDDYQQGPALTFYLLEQIRQNAPACKFVLLSSAAVYGNPLSLPVREGDPVNPISIYGYHKWQSEILCKEFSTIYGVPTASARIFSAYGVGLKRQVVWDIIQKALTQTELTLQGSGEESRDFIYSSDIAAAVGVILQSAAMRGEAYNVASGVETKIKDLVLMVSSALQAPLAVRYSGELPAGTPSNWRADISRVQSLGFLPAVSLQTGVQTVVKWRLDEMKGFSPRQKRKTE
jgi:UDP-glucose 4-epimerase